MRKHWLRAAVLPLLVGAAACGDDGPTGPADVTGMYTLESIGGDPIPYTTQQSGNFQQEIISSTLELRADRTYSEVTTYRETLDGSVNTFDETSIGTYTHNGTRVVLTDGSGGGSQQGTASATRLTFGAGGFNVVYRKQ